MNILTKTIFVLFITTSLFSQAKFEKVFETTYKDLPFRIRIENSGIYGVAMFDVQQDMITLSTYDNASAFQFSKAGFLGKKNLSEYPVDLSADPEKNTSINRNYKIVVEKRNKLSIIPFDQTKFGEITLKFDNNLAYADLIGTDSHNNLYLIIEKYLKDLPLKIKKEIFCLNSEGKILSVLEIPAIKYLSTVKDFQLDQEGNLFHLISDPEKIYIYKWSGLSEIQSKVIEYPIAFDNSFSQADFLPVAEPVINETAELNKPLALASRLVALRTGDSYVLHRYKCSSSNLAPVDVKAPDGDMVKTPAWVINGLNAKIPYKWGGFNTLAQFDDGMNANKYAGDINTSGVSSYSVGVDCSGFVSRCWQMTYHSSTSDMPNITYLYTSWDDLKPGDAILKQGHVRLFVEKCANGALKVVESSGRDWGVSYWTYTPSDLAAGGYSPRSYKNMTNDYSAKRPDITSALIVDTADNGTVKLTWKCDTSGVIGYRVYRSTDGVNFTLALNETSVLTTTATLPLTQKAEYYRVSSVSDAAMLTESNWSTVMGAGNVHTGKRALIVDGYERENVWRGTGNPFLAGYGLALAKSSASFETAKTSYIQSNNLPLNNYNSLFWLLGDESTENETFNSAEQTNVKKYLENGGALLVSGAEIGRDLSNKGTTDDRAFYNNYLKATYISDNSSSKEVKASDTSIFAGYGFNISQTVPVDYPDEITTFGGSILSMRYANNKGAGIQYSGKFGSSDKNGKVIYFGFPLESTANDTCFKAIIAKALDYFSNQLTSVTSEDVLPDRFTLSQNYPNPFNPSTVIKYSIPKETKVTLKVYDILGSEVAVLVNEVKTAGSYQAVLNNKIASGVYFYRIEAGSFTETKRMVLIK